MYKLYKNDKLVLETSSIKEVQSYGKNKQVVFSYINGYELLRDGTKEHKVNCTIKSIQSFLDDYEVDYDKSIKDPIKLVESVGEAWANRFNDGSGSGWIKY